MPQVRIHCDWQPRDVLVVEDDGEPTLNLRVILDHYRGTHEEDDQPYDGQGIRLNYQDAHTLRDELNKFIASMESEA